MTKARLAACVKCGTDLEPQAIGRPPRYCSPGCRRAAEHEIRRIARHLERLEREERDAVRQLDPETSRAGWGDRKWAERERVYLASEIERYEKRLRELCDFP